MGDEILVSVCCTAYNHEQYIRDALEGFVNQITDFKFEVIIHDDASADHTADIIREYETQYPDMIHAIYQQENQYSKGIWITNTFIYPAVRGKYMAFCEGDDYWTDMHKLQKQVDFLESHPEYSACVHNSIFLDCRTGKKRIRYQDKADTTLRLEDVLVGGGAQYQTSSLMQRRKYYKIPKELECGGGVGDYPRSIYLAYVGKIYYFKECMSTYRENVPGSWSLRNQGADKDISHYKAFLKMLNGADRMTKYEYKESIAECKKKFRHRLAGAYVKAYFPAAYKAYRRIRDQGRIREQHNI